MQLRDPYGQGSAVANINVIRCADWGAKPETGAVQSVAHAPTMIVVHHTATPNTTNVSRSHAISLARSIQHSHIHERGWIDSGQHFTVTRGGYILEGRHGSYDAMRDGLRHIIGAHTTGKNETAVGIENEGNYMSVAPPDDLWSSLAELCAAICQYYGLKPDQIFGHRDFNSTQCCGDKLYGKLGDLRTLVGFLLMRQCQVADWFRPFVPWP